MNRLCCTLVAWCLFTAMTSGPLQGAAIYSQVTPGEPAGAFSSLDLPELQKIGDNFVLKGSSPITVQSIRFVGGATGVSTPAPPDNFRIVFLENNSGSPGMPLLGGDFTIGTASRRTATSGQLLNGVTVPFEYLVNLPTGIVLSPDVEYWVSITNDLRPDHGWVWARVNGFFDQKIATTTSDVLTGSWTVGTAGGMYFELNSETIPEPTSLATLAVALSMIAIRRGPY